LHIEDLSLQVAGEFAWCGLVRSHPVSFHLSTWIPWI
jgi:hypothetical protein